MSRRIHRVPVHANRQLDEEFGQFRRERGMLSNYFGIVFGHLAPVAVQDAAEGTYISVPIPATYLTALIDDTRRPEPDGSIRTPARVTLFGFEATQAVASIQPRGRRWRVGGAAKTMGIFLLIAPVAAIVPPHAPWGIGALAAGVFLARRRMIERFTLIDLEGTCPKCEQALRVKRTRLRTPHAITCEGCHHQASLKLPPEALARGMTDQTVAAHDE